MPRITYSSGVTVDIGFNSDSLSESFEQVASQNESFSGRIQTFNMFGREEIRFDAMLDETAERRLWAWWSWARQGKPWSFALSTDRMSATSLSSAAAAAQNEIYIDSETGISVGDLMIIKAVDNDDEFEMIKINYTCNTSGVSSSQNLIYSYNTDDTIRHRDYYNQVIDTSGKYNPVKKGGKYYYTFKFSEKLD